jgi:phosphatidylglycerol:prolipoprotein diacylglycerol transferase
MFEVYNLVIFVAIGVLVGGRMVEVIFYEWSYYSFHLWHIPAIWLGGMSTHGILLGAIIAIIIYSKLKQRSFFEIADVLAIAGAFIMGFGRIGNFIDGQIVGSITDMWWGVKFPDVEGFRHPVVLYDGIKNLLLIPFLLLIRSSKPPRGVIVAHFILWYGFLRFLIDFFREYRAGFLGLPPGQEFNLFMTLFGICLLVWFYSKKRVRHHKYTPSAVNQTSTQYRRKLRSKKIIFVFLLILPMIIPSDWTQDIPKRYEKRHPGLNYSILYPQIDASHKSGSLYKNTE